MNTYAAVPALLKGFPNWVNWRYETRKGKTTKAPLDANTNGSEHASTNNKNTWAKFDKAAHVADIRSSNNVEGVGFVFTDTLQGADLDGVVQTAHDVAVIDPFALAIAKLANTYCEYSPSRTGVHLIWQSSTPLPSGNRAGSKQLGGELYDKNSPHYFTVTGDEVPQMSAKSIARIEDPDTVKLLHFLILNIPNAKLTKLWLGKWKETTNSKGEPFPSQSEADLALCNALARGGFNSSEKLDAAFRQSGLMRSEWEHKGKHTVAKALSGKKSNSEPAEVQRDEIAEEEQPDNMAPAYPTDTIDGDLIGELTRAMTDGTFIPPQFVREHIKVAVGSIVDGLVGFPNHEDLHTREYLHNVSVHPQSGKAESYKRTSQPSTGYLFDVLRKCGVSIVDGGLFGSGEFMVKVLKDAPTHRIIARFDEMSEVWAKNRAIGCTLEKKLLTLFESTSAAQGSFKNGVNAADDFHLSLVGDFTKDSFDASFTGSGSRGSGYLSRCVFQFADRQPCSGDWLSIDTEKVRRILSAIDARLTEIVNSVNRYVPAETVDAKAQRLEFFKWLDTQDARLTPRLKDHLKRDVLLRALLGGGTITAEMMRRSIDWCKNQLDNRLALFPEDAGSPTEIMERTIVRTLKAKGQTPERELKRACHVERAGYGGYEVFNRAVRSLMSSHEIRTAGTTRNGTPMYELFAVS